MKDSLFNLSCIQENGIMSMLNAGELECTTKNEGLPKSL